MEFNELALCVSKRWTPQIGDPDLISWVIVFAYLIAGGLTLAASRRAEKRGRIAWLLLSLFLIGLAINKQLDLHNAVTAVGRCISQAQGWYEARRDFQLRLMFAFGVAGVTFLTAMLFWLRNYLRLNLMAILGFGFLVIYVAERAVSFHHVDTFFGLSFAGLKMHGLFELAGTALIAINAALRLRRPPDTTGRF